jgi:hypothetical protein
MLPPDFAAASPHDATAWPTDLDPWDNAAVSEWLVGGGWLHWGLDVRDAPRRPGTWKWRRKRMLDVGLTLFVAPVAVMLDGVAALAILLTMGRPVFFRQNRPGFLCRPFEMWKLRTMRDLWGLARTLPAVLSTRDVSAEGRAAMEEMSGGTLAEQREASP